MSFKLPRPITKPPPRIIVTNFRPYKKLTILNYAFRYRFVVMSTTVIIIHDSIHKINDKILVILMWEKKRTKL